MNVRCNCLLDGWPAATIEDLAKCELLGPDRVERNTPFASSSFADASESRSWGSVRSPLCSELEPISKLVHECTSHFISPLQRFVGRHPLRDAKIALLSFRRLPEFDLVTLRVHDPAELSELRLLRFLQDFTPFSTERGQQSIEVGYAIVHHER